MEQPTLFDVPDIAKSSVFELWGECDNCGQPSTFYGESTSFIKYNSTEIKGIEETECTLCGAMKIKNFKTPF